jgi:hypothetical protein
VHPAIDTTTDAAVLARVTTRCDATKVDADPMSVNRLVAPAIEIKWLPVEVKAVLDATDMVVCVIPVAEMMTAGDVSVTLFTNVILPAESPPLNANMTGVVEMVTAPLRLTDNVEISDVTVISDAVVDDS